MKILSIILSLLFSLTLFAENKESKKADKLFESGDYLGAIEMYNLAMEIETDPVEKATYKYRIGECYYYTNKLDKAEKNLNDAIKYGYMNVDIYMLLGDVQLKAGRPDEALASYEKYRLANPGDSSIPMRIASVKFSKDNQHNLSLFSLNPATRLNSKQNDFGINYFNESILFSSSRSASGEDDGGDDEQPQNRFADQVIPKKKKKDTKSKAFVKGGLANVAVLMAVGGGSSYSRPQEIPELNKLKDFPADGIFGYDPYTRSLLYTNLDGKKAVIHVLRLENNQWKKREKIDVETQGFHVGHPFASPDGNRIYFTSKMPGGKGKSDIWYITKTGDSWSSSPINAGDNINTAGNEVTPFISNGYFFFASDGRIGMGGYDLFVSKITASGFEPPLNLGSPFNSPADDYNLIIKLDGREGMLVSSRNPKNADDIYMFEGFPSNLTVVGKITDMNTGAPISNVSIELFIEKKSLNKIVSDQNGDFILPVMPNTTYRLTASVAGYLSAEKTFTSPETLYARVSKENGINLDFALQSNAAVISGKAYDIQTLTPLEGAIVSLIAGGKVQQTVPVDPSGIYKFADLKSNTDYSLRLDPKGYFFETKAVRVGNSNQSFEYTKKNGYDLDFALQKYVIGKEIIIPKLYFQEDKANILTESFEELDKLAYMFTQNPHCAVILKCYVDVSVKNDIATRLSNFRVNAVKDYLVSKNVNPMQITPLGLGRSNALVRNPKTEDDRRLNNRVTYTVSKIDAVKELEHLTPVSQTPAGQPSQPQGSYSQQPQTRPTQTSTQTSQQQTYPQQQQQQQQQTVPRKTVDPDTLPFIVQVSSSGVLDMKDPAFAKIRTQLGYEVKYILGPDGKYKYFIGGFETVTEARDVVQQLKNIGIQGAFPKNRHQ